MNKFGFISHTIELSDLRDYAPALLKKPPAQCKKTLRSLPAKVITRITDVRSAAGAKVEGAVATTWLLPEQYLEMPNNMVLKKILDAARLLQKEGATIIGLGGFNSIVPAGAGRIVARNIRVGVTNGNSFTIISAIDAVDRALAHFSRPKEQVDLVIVGASGSIGSVITEIVAQQPYKKITICGRNRARLEGKAKKIQEHYQRAVHISTDTRKSVGSGDVVISATSTPERILSPHDFKSGAIVCDVAVPHDVSENTALVRDDVIVFEGGLVQMPDRYKLNPDISRSLSLPRSVAFACFAETALLSMEGIKEDFSLDGIKINNVMYMQQLAQKHGLKPAPFKNAKGFIELPQPFIEPSPAAYLSGSLERDYQAIALKEG